MFLYIHKLFLLKSHAYEFFQCPRRGEMDKKTLAANYYRCGLTFTEIAEILSQWNGINVSVRQLKRITSSQGLYRRKNKSSVLNIGYFICREIQRSRSITWV